MYYLQVKQIKMVKIGVLIVKIFQFFIKTFNKNVKQKILIYTSLLLEIDKVGKNLIIILELIKELKLIIFQLWVILMGKMSKINYQEINKLVKNNKELYCFNDILSLLFV